MDPNAALINMRDTIRQAERDLERQDDADNWHNLLARHEDTISALVEHFEALDAWLSKGGFLPDAWQR